MTRVLFGFLCAIPAVLVLPAMISNRAVAQGDVAAPVERVWTTRDGRHEIVATLVEVKNGIVRLRKVNGTTIGVSVAVLSDADKEYLEERTGVVRRSKAVPHKDSAEASGTARHRNWTRGARNSVNR